MDLLMNQGADVQYSDPYLPEAPKTGKYHFDLQSVDLTPESIQSFNVVVLATDHDSFDYELITREAKLVVDTRGRLKLNKNVFNA